MKFCYNTNFTLPKQSQGSRSILQDGSRSLGLFWNVKTSVLQPKKYSILNKHVALSVILSHTFLSLLVIFVMNQRVPFRIYIIIH